MNRQVTHRRVPHPQPHPWLEPVLVFAFALLLAVYIMAFHPIPAF